MAEGSDSLNGLGVPLFGDFEIKQRTAATDVMTITGAASQSGDFIVCQNSAGTEKFVVKSDGAVILPLLTTAPTGGVAGALYLVQSSTVIQIALANSSADLKYVDVSAAIS
jgi:protein involved in polysaccharide export with SLBB domain